VVCVASALRQDFESQAPFDWEADVITQSSRDLPASRRLFFSGVASTIEI